MRIEIFWSKQNNKKYHKYYKLLRRDSKVELKVNYLWQDMNKCVYNLNLQCKLINPDIETGRIKIDHNYSKCYEKVLNLIVK